MAKLKVAYFGTPDFSAKLLGKLVEDVDLPIEVVRVVTQPDKKTGRKQIVTPSPVKILAQEKNIPVSDDLVDIDLAILFAYGEVVSKDLLTKPRYGFWNVHPSLLPNYRGPSPVAEPLLRDDKETGVTIIKLDEELDHGPIIAQDIRFIFPLERRDQLTDRLIDLGFDLLKILLIKYIDDMSKVPETEQDHDKATYTKLLKKEDGYVEITKLKEQISNSSKELFNKFRAYYSWPGIWTLLPNEKRLKITKMHLENKKIVIKKVQLEGKKEVSFEEFERAYTVFKI